MFVRGMIVWATTSNESQAAGIAQRLLNQGRDATTADVSDLHDEGYGIRTLHTYAVLAEPICDLLK